MPRPQVTLKLATSLDGKIALANGRSEWITGEKSREAGRRLRASHDGIAIGSNTAVIDNPQLTTRISGEPDPVRILFDSDQRLSPDSNLARTARDVPVWLFCRADKDMVSKPLKDMGVRILTVPYNDGLDVLAVLDIVKRQGISSLLLEGGGTLAASFLKADVIDVIEWFRAPMIIGGDGRSGVRALELETLDRVKRFARVDIQPLGDDMHERYERIQIA